MRDTLLIEHEWVTPGVPSVMTRVAEAVDERTGIQRSFSLIETTSLLVGLAVSTSIRMRPSAACNRVIAQRGRV